MFCSAKYNLIQVNSFDRHHLPHQHSLRQVNFYHQLFPPPVPPHHFLHYRCPHSRLLDYRHCHHH